MSLWLYLYMFSNKIAIGVNNTNNVTKYKMYVLYLSMQILMCLEEILLEITAYIDLF